MSATSHIKYLVLSQEFFISYKTIVQEFPQVVDKFHVKYSLLCRSIEYLLKSWLLFCGETEKNLKDSYGHNLEKLLAKVIVEKIEKKLNLNFTNEFKAVLTKLNYFYKNKDIDYPKVGYKSIPLYIQLNEPMEVLLTKMEEFYRSDLRQKRIAKDTK